jgi:hypothetical protein
VKFVVIRVIHLFVLRNKSPDGTVVSSLSFGREETSGELFRPPVVGNAFTTFSLPVAGFIGAGALDLVLFDIAFKHQRTPFKPFPPLNPTSPPLKLRGGREGLRGLPLTPQTLYFF